MKIEDSNEKVRDSLKEEITETYSLIDKLFKSLGFFIEVFNDSLINFITFFSKKNK